ncbi:hypothetical protein GQ43DRAFT_468844 [Delitschia confertaspora ATCC 74209]|uniref:Kelch repeat protein n=1 Tax=Delitschia confertaspora ATCC 74209 TaxID=1513339 RepID=A0A9P4JY97_9PLEO|nr:hypothetical protein GQ43DRAFT_468844 [Delitschia confertaspora ATCC 74209]
MAFVRKCLFAALSFAALSVQDVKDPLKDFCRRWGHQTAEVDGKLYIDGGQVTWNPQSANPLNYTNIWLLYSDLNTTTGDIGMPLQYANLTKNSSVPSVSGGILWPDEVNKVFYLYGGEYQGNPEEFTFWAYDTILNQWNVTQFKSNVNTIHRVAFGAGTVMEDLGRGFYYGGWLNNKTIPGWTGPPIATNNMIEWDMTRSTLNNNTGPEDGIGRAEGVMTYLPASDGGLLVYFGGIEDPYKNGSFVAANMSKIHIYDVSSSKWYTQTASGTIPPARRRFCAGATWADDYSSFNIHLYGGMGIPNITGFDDVYILTLPSFTWIKAFPGDNSNGSAPHGMTTCNVVNRDQMIVMGGWFAASDACDSPNGWGQHNMNLGYNGAQRALWDKYDPKLSTYIVPTPVISVVGGGPTGGATVTKPSSWDNPDLSVYFTRVATFTPRSATRIIPTSTGTPKDGSDSSKINVAAIAGGAAGGLVGLIIILCLILYCLHRRKKAQKEAEKRGTRPPDTPPTELPATSPRPVHEMPSPGASKYLMQQQRELPPNTIHPAFAGSTGSQSPSTNPPESNFVSPLSPYNHSTTYTATTPSPHDAEPTYHGYQSPQHAQNRPSLAKYADQPYPPDHPNYVEAYEAQQRDYSYPPLASEFPTSAPRRSPQMKQPAYDISQPVTQTYYPPPPEPTPHSISHHQNQTQPQTHLQHQSHSYSHSHSATHLPQSSNAGHSPRLDTGTPEGNGRQYDVELDRSTENTPAQFYVARESRERVSQSRDGNGGGERRPVRGRFVEVE